MKIRKLEGDGLIQSSFSGYETLRKRNSNNPHEGESPIGPHVVVLPVLLAPSALWPSLPRAASSFFPCHVWIHLSPFPKDRMWSGSVDEITNLMFPNARQMLPEPIWVSQDGGSLGVTSLCHLDTKGIKSFHRSFCRKSWFCLFS